ncbi:hypothetical protein D9758_001504 [Tetrapyrgos nigripes]|uniref:FAD-binding domain-containing protein n=1 Tax=Tetrapyrgos nigripes TaxID=182062 RepID=A0A8H5GXI6_9AGAR|nr:hypothetical protein D9758_001504 [Tetrapyrgos nigripes]
MTPNPDTSQVGKHQYVVHKAVNRPSFSPNFTRMRKQTVRSAVSCDVKVRRKPSMHTITPDEGKNTARRPALPATASISTLHITPYESKEAMENRVLIIGAGTVGLLIAQSLKKVGIPCIVFEQAASVDARPRDWSFGVYWAQTPLAECLPEGIDEKYIWENAQVDKLTPREDLVLPYYNSETGELMKNIPTPFSIRLARRKLLKILAQGVDIRYEKRLADVKVEGETVTAIFEDGTKEEGKLLIGCDGAHSRVRNFLLVGAIDKNTRTIPNLTQDVVTVHDGIDSDPAKWKFTLLITWPETESDMKETGVNNLSTRPDIVQDMKRRTEAFAEPFRSFFQAVPNDALAWHNRLSNWPTEKWDNKNGRVTLAGDAAHPMTFHRGQGLNNAITDACTLLRALREHHPADVGSYVEALKVYEGDVWKRGREAVLSNEENTMMLHDWKSVEQSPIFNVGVVTNAPGRKAKAKV